MDIRHEREGRGLLDGNAQPFVDARWGVLHGAQQYLVTMCSPMDDGVLATVKATLRGHGGWLSSYVPDSTVLGIGPPAAAHAVSRVPGVLWVVRAQTAMSQSKHGRLMHATLYSHGNRISVRCRLMPPTMCFTVGCL